MTASLGIDVLESPNGVDKIHLIDVPNGFVVSSKLITYSTRTALGVNAANSEVIAFSGTFVKTRSDTDIIATCTVFGNGAYSGNCGVGIKFGSYWDWGCGYEYDNQWQPSQTIPCVGQCYWQHNPTNINIPAGTYTVGWGWSPNDGSSGNKPFAYINPNSTDDGRNQQFISSIFVYEIKK